MTTYEYMVILKPELNLTRKFTDALGDYLVNQMDKTSDIKVKFLAIEKENKAKQPHIHIEFKTSIPRPQLIEQLDNIKKYTPVSLNARRVILRSFPIFAKYRGQMACKDFRDKDKCPGKQTCNRLNEYKTLLCESNTNLQEIKTTQHLDNLKEYLAKKKGNDNTLYYYEAK